MLSHTWATRIRETNSFKAAIRENLDPRNISAIQYVCLDCRLASLEAGEKDSTEFTRWQEDMKQVHTLLSVET